MKNTMHGKFHIFIIAWICLLACTSVASAQTSLKKLLSYPTPGHLVSSSKTGSFAWTFNYMGKRNIYLSSDGGKNFRQLTHYTKDNGQQISHLQFSPDGKWLVYMRGAEPGGNWSESVLVNPLSSPREPQFQLLSLNIASNEITVLASGMSNINPAVSPNGKTVVFVDHGVVKIVPVDGSGKPKQMFFARGNCSSLRWSPDGSKLAFVSYRGSHSFIGIFSGIKTPIKWIDPSFSRDRSPVWSPDGNSIVFVRRPAYGGARDSILARHPRPWEIRIADIHGDSSSLVWKSPHTLNGSVPTTSGGYNLHWAANNRIIFMATLDDWPHLYSISVGGGKPLLLTPGHFMVEAVQLSPDRRHLIFSANTGSDKLDIDRRHIGVVSVDKADMKMLTPGEGIETYPVYINDKAFAFISSTPYRPAIPAVLERNGGKMRLIGTSLLSGIYNKQNQVKPKQVTFKSFDGTIIHGQLFRKMGDKTPKPAVVAVHGGPMRQMLLGWHYNSYYAAHYAVNQWLATHGYVVLSVNYRMGIGYGNNFHHPAHSGSRGLAEYKDVLAAGKWLAKQAFVDKNRIGVYGGSYGGYLTGLALGKNSNIFAAGVDISGMGSMLPGTKYTFPFKHAPDAALADSVAWKASPDAYVSSWESPVLFIHGDDDRNVHFDQSIDLFNRLNRKGVDTEALVIPDETHHWLRFHDLVKIYTATINFFERELMDK